MNERAEALSVAVMDQGEYDERSYQATLYQVRQTKKTPEPSMKRRREDAEIPRAAKSSRTEEEAEEEELGEEEEETDGETGDEDEPATGPSAPSV
ncbi:Hypothetical protein FKW44_006737 [Caligus rogercresseyi]|uniref:Uncharacterized protein n=1 Tax=Caligus rogercresseyi TaxID=217165 RepID=A0A7T8KDP8_CALRO|nr:Hypothetical protein FKW44_006737 [Caligus rogercresseyi]